MSIVESKIVGGRFCRIVLEQAADGDVIVAYFHELLDPTIQIPSEKFYEYIEDINFEDTDRFKKSDFHCNGAKHSFRRIHHEDNTKVQSDGLDGNGSRPWKAYVFTYCGDKNGDAMLSELHNAINDVMNKIYNGLNGLYKGLPKVMVFEDYDPKINNITQKSHYRPLDHIITDEGVQEQLDELYGMRNSWDTLYDHFKIWFFPEFADGFFSRLEGVGGYTDIAVRIFGYPTGQLTNTTYDLLEDWELEKVKAEARRVFDSFDKQIEYCTFLDVFEEFRHCKVELDYIKHVASDPHHALDLENRRRQRYILKQKQLRVSFFKFVRDPPIWSRQLEQQLQEVVARDISAHGFLSEEEKREKWENAEETTEWLGGEPEHFYGNHCIHAVHKKTIPGIELNVPLVDRELEEMEQATKKLKASDGLAIRRDG